MIRNNSGDTNATDANNDKKIIAMITVDIQADRDIKRHTDRRRQKVSQQIARQKFKVIDIPFG